MIETQLKFLLLHVTRKIYYQILIDTNFTFKHLRIFVTLGNNDSICIDN